MLMNSNEYIEVFTAVKRRIQSAQYQAAVQVNREMILLYYGIGQIINAQKSWGNKFIDNLAKDIQLSFPGATGYSVRNLKYMAKFAAEFPEEEFVQQAVAQIPWGHITTLLDRVPEPAARAWYIDQIPLHGWSRNVLIHQIESGLYDR